MIDDFKNIYKVLVGGINPEITHFQFGQHPGIGWYLKTIIPNRIDVETDPFLELHDFIDNLSTSCPSIIMLTSYAYNWFQQKIPNCRTIWMRDGIDIRIYYNQQAELEFTICEKSESIREFGLTFVTELEDILDNHILTNEQKEEIEKLAEISKFLYSYTDNEASLKLRNKIRVNKYE